MTSAVERGDLASGPSVILGKFKPGCAVAWHFHTPNETILMVSGEGRLQAKGDKPVSLRAGDYAWMPAKHVHMFSTEQGCVMFVTSDGAFDIHYVDDKGNEVYHGLGRKAEAEATQRRALQLAEKHIELHPDDARALYIGAGILARIGDRERSFDWARRALAIDPEETSILYNVACVYALLARTFRTIHRLSGKGDGVRDFLPELG